MVRFAMRAKLLMLSSSVPASNDTLPVDADRGLRQGTEQASDSEAPADWFWPTGHPHVNNFGFVGAQPSRAFRGNRKMRRD